MKKNFTEITKKLFATGLAFTVAVSSSFVLPTTISAYSGFTGDYTRLERLEQPTSKHEFAAGELGVVNFQSKYGDKQANIDSMLKYIEEAHKQGVKILLFPEMCVNGYVSSSDATSESYKWAVSSAETLDGPTAKTFAQVADDDDMWIIYGATETIPGDSLHAYNSAFACSPEGDVTSYQKITPVEGSWCTAGDTPVLLDAGEYGKLGLSICYDTYSTPEIERYYAAMGCNLLLNPTASGGNWYSSNVSAWEEYYKLRLESVASRDGMTILSSDLVGDSGMASGKNDIFPGGSVILQAAFNGPKYFAGATDSTGVVNDENSIVIDKEGLITNSTTLTASSGSTCSNQDFNPEMYAKLYKDIAAMETIGVKSVTASAVTTGPTVSVVNMTGYWGNKKKTLAKMVEYIEEAAKQKADMIVFPETVLSGYGYVSADKDPFYKKYGVPMQVATAETVPGASTTYLSEYAKKYNMYIIFGMTEKDASGPIYEDNKTEKHAQKVYNSAAILYPDGTIDSYQKIHRAGLETEWSVCGKTPKMIDTKWGRIGIDICRDGHFYPELGRYYAAMGCTLFVHPTATTGNAWYRSTRIGSYTDRDGMAAVTCNLLGGDGIYNADGSYDVNNVEGNFDAEGNFVGGTTIPDIIYNQKAVENDPYWNSANWIGSGGIFNSTSLIITKGSTSGLTPSPRLNYNSVGSASTGFLERGKTSPLGIETATMNLNGTGFNPSAQTFNPSLFSKMYDKLAMLYRGGYTSIYGGNAVKDAKTIHLSASTVVTTGPAITTEPAVTTEPTSTPAPTAKVKTFKKSGATYKVTNGKKVTFVSTTKTKSVTVPATVTYKGVTYTVTAIGAKAFYKVKTLKTITIKSTKLTKIGSKAFAGISKTATVKVPKTKLSAYKKLLKKAGLPSKAKVKK
ncbi:MAG: leucine-rich repeat protein [Lachnospiraceae bacterium]|nr:leucine-rich repeat protein [Lachnospiraceae bacterium]